MTPKGTKQQRYKENPYTQHEISECLVAYIAFAGNSAAAVAALKAQGKPTPTASGLTNWAKTTHAEEYERIREVHGPAIEAKAVHDMREIVALSHLAARTLLIRTIATAGKEKDPARAAANVATVADKMQRSSLALQGRPTSITENRNLEEILTGLRKRNIIRFDGEAEDEPPALPEANGDEG